MNDEIRRVLLVEDDANHVELIKRAFSPYRDRYELIVAESLDRARRELQAMKPDLIIADLVLPDDLAVGELHASRWSFSQTPVGAGSYMSSGLK